MVSRGGVEWGSVSHSEPQKNAYQNNKKKSEQNLVGTQQLSQSFCAALYGSTWRIINTLGQLPFAIRATAIAIAFETMMSIISMTFCQSVDNCHNLAIIS